MNREIMEKKVEASIPVQARVSLMELAELVEYWRSIGHHVRSMSQLVGWSISLLREVLVANNKMPREFESVAEAHQYMEMLGLYQPGMRSKGIKKIRNAMAFESLRIEGVNPKSYAPQHYETVHNERSVRPFVGKVAIGKYFDVIDEANAKLAEVEREEIEARKIGILSKARESGLVTVKEGEIDLEEVKRRSEERIKLENQPIDTEFIKDRLVKE